MKCLYINLERAEDRRRSLEASFAAVPHAGWELARLPAVDAQDAELPPGRISDVEKACFLSHRAALESALGDEEPVFIVEDDVAFGARCFPLLSHWAAQGGPWDLIYTDYLVTDYTQVVRLMREWPERIAGNRFELLRLARTWFAGASAYLVNGGSKRKIVEMLREVETLDAPLDLTLQGWVRQGRLTGLGCFPTVTTLAETADASQVQGEAFVATDFIYNTLRRVMFAERDEAACRAACARIERELANDTSRLMGAVFSGLMALPPQAVR